MASSTLYILTTGCLSCPHAPGTLLLPASWRSSRHHRLRVPDQLRRTCCHDCPRSHPLPCPPSLVIRAGHTRRFRVLSSHSLCPSPNQADPPTPPNPPDRVTKTLHYLPLSLSLTRTHGVFISITRPLLRATVLSPLFPSRLAHV